jgi:uncharacterized protein (DUF58 family)
MFKRAGSSFDLKNIREYGPTDDPRRIDWKLMGRTDRLYVKEFFEEERDGVCVLVDLSASIGVFGTEEALRISASLAWILGALGLPTSLWAFDDHIVRRMERPRGDPSPAPVLAFFEGLEASGRTDVGSALAAARKVSRFRRAVVISDFLDAAFRPAASPFGRSFFVRLHKDFEAMNAGNSEVEVIDPETEARLRTPWDAPAKAHYRQREKALDAAFGEAQRPLSANRGAWYRRIAPGADRAALYWELLEGLYA